MSAMIVKGLQKLSYVHIPVAKQFNYTDTIRKIDFDGFIETTIINSMYYGIKWSRSREGKSTPMCSVAAQQ